MLGNMTIGKRLALGFGVVLVVLLVVVVLSFTGTAGVVGDAEEVIYGNQLDGIMAQREIDHLNWVNKVNELLTDDNVTQLSVELDDHKCGFGKWLYGEERKEAESKIQGLASILSSIEEPHSKLHKSAGRIKEVFVQADSELPGIIAAREVDHLKWADAIRDAFLENEDSIKVQTDPTACALGKWLSSEQAQKAYQHGSPELKQAWDKMVASHTKLHESAVHVVGKYARIHTGLNDLLLNRLLDHKNWAGKVSEAIIVVNPDLGVQTDHSKCAYGTFLASEQCAQYAARFPEFSRAIEESKSPHTKLHESAIAISEALRQADGGKAKAEKIFQEQTLPALAHVGECFQKAIEAETKLCTAQAEAKKIFDETTVPLLHETLANLVATKDQAERQIALMRQSYDIYAQETIPSLTRVQSSLHEARKKVADEIMTEDVMLSSAQGLKRNVGMFGIAGIIAGLALAFVIGRSVIAALKKTIDFLSQGADQVAAASSEVSSASQSLAEGATEQAAGLEETSSSLEEMASMTRQNADNAQQANTLAADARKAADIGTESMTRMNNAIQEIQKSSDETAKIVKVIDEIAFQTNLLALNAAVEAARAGEAGKGFAVVAEEVRNLAMRSAEAAKNTTAMIEESVKNSRNGVDIAAEVAKVLEEIVGSISKTTDLIGEIAAASAEQAQGIDQVNTAVAQMDKVTQQNAANAEESASASEELSAQAEQMNQVVADLTALVGGSSAHGRRQTSSGGASRRHSNFNHGAGSGMSQSDRTFHQIADTAGPNCWDVKKCGRIPGGNKAGEMGICPAYPNDGRSCWAVAGTFCGGKVQGSAAQKQGGCLTCNFYKDVHRSVKARSAASAIPFDDDFREFNA